MATREIRLPSDLVLNVLRRALGEAVIPANIGLITVGASGGIPNLAILFVVGKIPETEAGEVPS